VNEWMSSKDRKNAHVLLRMVQFMESPEHPNAMVHQVREPIAAVHGDKDQNDHGRTRKKTKSWQNNPRQGPARNQGEGQ